MELQEKGGRLDSHSTPCAALMSIRPEFAARLLAGEKQVEFRRRPPARGVTHILIYATSPVRAVVGVAEVERLERASPRELWSAFADVRRHSPSDFFAYFAGTRMGCAYVVKRIWSCSPPKSLGRHGLPRDRTPSVSICRRKDPRRRPQPVGGDKTESSKHLLATKIDSQIFGSIWSTNPNSFSAVRVS